MKINMSLLTSIPTADVTFTFIWRRRRSIVILNRLHGPPNDMARLVVVLACLPTFALTCATWMTSVTSGDGDDDDGDGDDAMPQIWMQKLQIECYELFFGGLILR